MLMHCMGCGVEKEEWQLFVSEQGILCQPCEARAFGYFGDKETKRHVDTLTG